MSKHEERTRTFNLGKIDWNGTGRKAYPAEVTITLRKCGGEPTFTVDKNGTRTYTGNNTPEYMEFSATGTVWNTRHTDWVCAGQCLDEIAKHKRKGVFAKIFPLWKKWHLNGMNAGTPEQEAAIKAWKACGNAYDYNKACDFLKSIDLYTVRFTGKTAGRMYEDEPYTYGHAWVVRDLPADVLAEIEGLLEGDA